MIEKILTGTLYLLSVFLIVVLAFVIYIGLKGLTII